MNFDLNKYKSTDYVMHCKSQENAMTFLEFLDENNKTWITGESYMEKTNWETYKEDTVYYFNKGTVGDISHAMYWSKRILEFDDFDWEGNLTAPENKELNDFLDSYAV